VPATGLRAAYGDLDGMPVQRLFGHRAGHAAPVEPVRHAPERVARPEQRNERAAAATRLHVWCHQCGRR
jgi:hypothetical protein